MLAYFGNNNQNGFKDRALTWYNPVSDRNKFNCGYRLCLNVYKNCSHGCRYCYVNGYSSEMREGKRKPNFLAKLQRDIDDFKKLQMPPCPVHMSNSTDPLQAKIETLYKDTLGTLRILCENQDIFTQIIILTKNPSLLLTKEYLKIVKDLKDRLIVEVTVPFYRDNYKLFEPGAPAPKERILAIWQLLSNGIIVRLRLDPLFPIESNIQTRDDIVNILDETKGVQCVISKPLRLVHPKSKDNSNSSRFFDEMAYYYSGGKKNGVKWHGGRYVYSKDRTTREMMFLVEECARRETPFVHCKQTVLVDKNGTPYINHLLNKHLRYSDLY